MADTTLVAIRKLVRWLTKSPTPDLLTDATIDENVNTYTLYDFPQALRLFDLHTTVSWTCLPYVDTYKTDKSTAPTWPLYNFRNRYTSVNPPVYVAGYLANYSQSREQFYGAWPQVASIQQQTAGDGATTNFSGFVTNAGGASANNAQGTFILQNNVTFSSVDTNNNGVALVDQPILDSVTLLPTQYGRMYNPSYPAPAPLVLPAPYTTAGTFPNNNFINYYTGQYNITFTAAPKEGQAVNSQVYYYVPSRPLSVLYYDNQFVLRPVPDQPYKITIEAYTLPSELLLSAQSPELEQWWQLIAYGAAIKILQRRFDYDGVALITPEFKNQENLALSRTVVQQTTQRVGTIYSNQNDLGPGWSNWNGYGQWGV